MSRSLDSTTLDGAARFYASSFLSANRKNSAGTRFISGPKHVMQDLYDATYLDEHEWLAASVLDYIGPRARADFERMASETFAPRDEAMFHRLLADKLAISPDGEHIPGKRGTVQVGRRSLGRRAVVVEALDSIYARREARRLGLPEPERRTREILTPYYWPIFAGEHEERERIRRGEREFETDADNASAVDPFPIGGGAPNPWISNEAAIAGLDAILARLDEGTGAAVIQGRTGVQPANVDTVASGTLLFTLVCSATAFAGATDGTDKATATAGAITSDASADDTGTLGYCRASATNDGATPLDDHIDGSAGTSDSDFVFNSVSIVAGAGVDMTSWVANLPEGT